MRTNRYAALSISIAFLAMFVSTLPVQGQGMITLDHARIMPLSPEAAALHNAINYPIDGNIGKHLQKAVFTKDKRCTFASK